MTEYQMATTSLCEFAGCVLLIIAYTKRDKLKRFERGTVQGLAVYVAVFKDWRKERVDREKTSQIRNIQKR